MVTRDRPGAARWLCLIGIPLLAFLTLSAWAFASPVGSSPDDDFHLASIWCGLGDREGLCESVDDSPARSVPAVLMTSVCYAFNPEQSAGCWDPAADGMVTVERANTDGLYPRIFYATMSTFASPDVQTSVIAIRLVNSAFAVGLLTGVFFALPRRLRPALVISVIATSVPLGMFVYASTNPSSWALLSAATVWICLYATTQTTGRRQYTLAGLALLGTIVGAGARADAAIFAVYGAVLALVLGLHLRRGRRSVVPLAASLAVFLVSIALYFSARQGGAAFGGLDPADRRLTISQHISNLLDVPALWTGALGQSNLGWLDTRMPAVVWVTATAVFTGALFIGIRFSSRRRSIAVILALLAMWLVPFVMLAQSNAVVGATVQPRYLLPLLIIALGVASLRADAELAWDGLRFGLAAVCLWVGVTVALHLNIQRYTSGSDGEAIDPGANAQWWWTGVPSPLAVWVIGSVAFAGMLGLLWVAKQRAVPAESPRGVGASSTDEDAGRVSSYAATPGN